MPKCDFNKVALDFFRTPFPRNTSEELRLEIAYAIGYRNLWILDASVGRWTLDAGLWILDSGRWTLDAGLWTLDATLWTLGSGHWTLDTVVDCCRTESEPSF